MGVGLHGVTYDRESDKSNSGTSRCINTSHCGANEHLFSHTKSPTLRFASVDASATTSSTSNFPAELNSPLQVHQCIHQGPRGAWQRACCRLSGRTLIFKGNFATFRYTCKRQIVYWAGDSTDDTGLRQVLTFTALGPWLRTTSSRSFSRSSGSMSMSGDFLAAKELAMPLAMEKSRSQAIRGS